MWVIASVSCFLLTHPTLYVHVYGSVLQNIVFGIFIIGYIYIYIYIEPPLKSSLNFGQLDYFPDLFL